MRFPRTPHEQLLTSASASVEALPYEEVPLPRTFWPWQWGCRLPQPRAVGAPERENAVHAAETGCNVV
jgi:hypothetical protein